MKDTCKIFTVTNNKTNLSNNNMYLGHKLYFDSINNNKLILNTMNNTSLSINLINNSVYIQFFNTIIYKLNINVYLKSNDLYIYYDFQSKKICMEKDKKTQWEIQKDSISNQIIYIKIPNTVAKNMDKYRHLYLKKNIKKLFKNKFYIIFYKYNEQ